jgi:hypothetical protein
MYISPSGIGCEDNPHTSLGPLKQTFGGFLRKPALNSSVPGGSGEGIVRVVRRGMSLQISFEVAVWYFEPATDQN